MRELTKFSVILLVFITTSTCRAKITIADSRVDEIISDLVESSMDILTSCYEDRINPVAVAGYLPDILFRELANRYTIPVVAINRSPRITNNLNLIWNQGRPSRYQLKVFIIGASSLEEFINLMQNYLTHSIWWNHAASFVILNFSPRCQNSGNLLALAWQYSILDVNVICMDHELKKRIYNYNPYTNQAPASWEKIFVVPGIDNHPFTVFNQKYRKNENICAEIRFEKTKDLGGYRIKIFAAQAEDVPHHGNLQTSLYSWEALNRIYRIIAGVLNATLIRDVRPGDILDEEFDELEEIPAAIVNVVNGLLSYPHDRAGTILISAFRGHKSQLTKILTVIDLASRYSLGIVYIITFIFLRLFLRQASMPAILNLIRITCDTGFTNLRHTTSTRIYLTCLLFFAVTMQGIYQGNLASLLTTNIPFRSVNTINDVVDLGYKVYGTKVFKSFIDNQNVLEHYIEIEERGQCVEYLKNDSLGACIEVTQGFVIDQARELKLHVSNEVLEHLYIAFHIRWNWPLEQRFNIIIQKMVEADVLKPWPARFKETSLTEFAYDEKVMKNKDFKNIELHEVAFAFVILSIGLVCATIAFIGELALHKFRSKVVTVRVEILN